MGGPNQNECAKFTHSRPSKDNCTSGAADTFGDLEFAKWTVSEPPGEVSIATEDRIVVDGFLQRQESFQSCRPVLEGDWYVSRVCGILVWSDLKRPEASVCVDTLRLLNGGSLSQNAFGCGFSVYAGDKQSVASRKLGYS